MSLEALGGATAAFASSVGRSEAPEALSESHRSLSQGSSAAVSDILNNPDKFFYWIIEVLQSRPTRMNIVS